MNERLAAALEFRERGLCPLPLAPRAKVPAANVLNAVHGDSGWTAFCSRPPSPPEIREWFAVEPKLNVGVVLGTASNGEVVIDIDGADPGLRHPPTPCVRTHRGVHLYMSSSDEVRTRKFAWGEVRGGRSYVVAPPSIHPEGSVYEWRIGLDDVELADLSSLALPEGGRFQDRGTQEEDPLPEYPSSQGPLPPEAELARDEDAVRAALPPLSVEAELDHRFSCVLPGHHEQHPSASVARAQSGVFRYFDWHQRSGPSSFTLAHVRASLAYKRVVLDLHGPSLARWYLRLFFDAGIIKPVEVEIAPLPSGCRPAVRRVAEGFRLLLGLRWLADPETPTPFTWDFAAAWCGISRRHAGAAILELRRLGVIAVAGQEKWHTASGPRTAHLYAPGDGRPWRPGR